MEPSTVIRFCLLQECHISSTAPDYLSQFIFKKNTAPRCLQSQAQNQMITFLLSLSVETLIDTVFYFLFPFIIFYWVLTWFYAIINCILLFSYVLV